MESCGQRCQERRRRCSAESSHTTVGTGRLSRSGHQWLEWCAFLGRPSIPSRLMAPMVSAAITMNEYACVNGAYLAVFLSAAAAPSAAAPDSLVLKLRLKVLNSSARMIAMRQWVPDWRSSVAEGLKVSSVDRMPQVITTASCQQWWLWLADCCFVVIGLVQDSPQSFALHLKYTVSQKKRPNFESL